MAGFDDIPWEEDWHSKIGNKVNYNPKIPKRTNCFQCGGNLIPSVKTDIIGWGENTIIIQLYKCVDCDLETRIPVYEQSATVLGDPELVMESSDKIHNHRLA